MFIEINLVPENLRKRKARLKLPKTAPVYLFGGVLSFLILFGLIVQTVVVCRRHGVSRLSKRWELIQPQKVEIEGIKKEISASDRKLTELEALSGKGFLWAKKLSDLSDSLTSGIWLTRLYLSEKVITNPVKKSPGEPQTEKIIIKYLELEGSTLAQGEEGTASVGRFIRSLKSNPGFFRDFSNIESRWIKRKQTGQVEVMSFKLSCRFKDIL